MCTVGPTMQMNATRVQDASVRHPFECKKTPTSTSHLCSVSTPFQIITTQEVIVPHSQLNE
jgi:hypothetical protein